MSSVNATGTNTSVLSGTSIVTAPAATVLESAEQSKQQPVSAADKVTISEEARLLLESDQAVEADDTGIEPPKATALDTGIEPPKVTALDTGIEPPKQN